jgi:hypothetical protein
MFKILKSFTFYVSTYLAIIRCIKIVGEIAALLYTVVTLLDTFPQFYDLILKFPKYNFVFVCHVCWRLV